MSHTVSDLRDLVAQLRQADPSFRVFGSDAHRYQLRPRLSAQEVAAFEGEHGIALPDDYRAFLLDVGDGGAGPYFGLTSLDRAAQHSALADPFPFVEATDALDEDDATLEHVQDDYPGLLQLCHFGSGLYFFLVVTGSARGTLWMGREHFYPEASSFLAWYEDWATQKLTRLQNQDLVARLRPGMHTDDVERLSAVTWKKRATSTMWVYESPSVPAQLVLNEEDTVVAVKASLFI